MTTHLHLPVQSITGVRLACRTCDSAVVIPLDARNAPTRCFNCSAPMPGPDLLRDVISGLAWLKDASEGPEVTFDAALEGGLETHLHP